ncbi:MAG: hypothetical protein K1X94_34065, partial [Sandaracinaceae bacterium]|nr:hypothetical protein [Sandaracinaceae bacterium]
VYKSTDRGEHWAQCNTGIEDPRYLGVAGHPTDPDTAWVIGWWGRIWYTNDGGASWAEAPGTTVGNYGSYFAYRPSMHVSRRDPSIVWAAGHGGVYRSRDGGRTFEPAISAGQITTDVAYNYGQVGQALAIDPNDDEVVYAYLGAFVAKTTNALASSASDISWQDMSAISLGGDRFRGRGFQLCAGSFVGWNPFFPEQFYSLSGDYGKMTHSEDYLWSWYSKSRDPIATFRSGNYVACAADGTVYIGTGWNYGDSDIYPDDGPSGSSDPSFRRALIKGSRAADGTLSWGYMPLPARVMETTSVYCLPTDSSKVWICMGPCLMFSGDGGQSWTDVYDSLNHGYNIAADPTDPTGNSFYVSGGGEGIFRVSRDPGTNAHSVTRMPGSPAYSGGNFVAVDPGDPSVLWVACAGGLMKYAGGEWTTAYAHPIKALAIDPGNPQRMAIGAFFGGFFDVWDTHGIEVTQDGGATWTRVSDGLPTQGAYFLAFNPDRSAQLAISAEAGGCFMLDLGTSTPRDGAPAVIGGTVSAARFDDGGFGVAHNVSGGPSVVAGGSGQVVDGVPAGSWIKYSVEVTAGTYDVVVRGRSVSGGARVHLELNGSNLTGPQALSEGAIGDTRVSGVELEGGSQYLKLYVERGVASFESLTFTPS